ncbi:filamentous hemagglutinin N-terminal domain-containing protein [Chroococcidiopsis thermalis]|uniref:Filamentous hemagglutinin family outer membrane protein n=1 Tax=Chroococcidiopsis thermalis (strain PCC 7203) TaxID=251229 RepID=K9U2Y1_CHRTP|nr:filamentous hemagglutinin N-terminal domain-containing protein [Chroococcidiopsis thermalis]AFY89180.1 filamentous hemagglutinin family outer membrane protein [Chroococcidiopsis thermalis PCC 7203]
MDTSDRRWNWKLGRTIILGLSGAIAFWENCAYAQITPDTTLGNENSTVTSTGTVDSINGGATRGANLFHSFEEFNVESGRAAYFNNPAGIENILTRVTGGNPSNILGTLGVAGGNANLFLINPNGIIFGANARLDVSGSFVGTTASGIGLANGDTFSANPGEPLPNQLLNVNPNAFFFNQINAGAIVNRSTADSRGLEVPQGKSLLLVGGDVNLEGGRLSAPGGEVELAGVANTGAVGLSNNGSDLGLSFPTELQRADVSLSNRARVNVSATGGGSIAIFAQNLDISAGSSLVAGVGTGLGSVDTQAGNIKIDATDTVAISGTSSTDSSSGISNVVSAGATGSAGNIEIKTGSLSIIGNALVGSATDGRGNAGSVSIQASDKVSFSGVNSGVLSSVASSGMGNGADVNIQTRSLSLSDGAQLATSTFGQGDSGNIQVNATDSVSFSSGSRLQALTFGGGNAGNVTIKADDTVSFDSSSALSNVFINLGFRAQGKGKGGNINIQARSLSLTNNATLNSSTFGQGDAGNIQVNATDSVSFSGSSTILATSAGLGNAGDVMINAGDAVSFDGQGTGIPSGINTVVALSAGSDRQGGNINIQARSLSLINNATLNSSTLGQGDAGSISVQASDSVSLDNSFIISAVGQRGVGNGGDINVQTRSMKAIDGAKLQSQTFGTGNAGNISVNAIDSVTLSGVGLSGSSLSGNILERGYSSGLISSTEATASGQGGEIRVTTSALRVVDGAVLSARTRNAADGGNIFINANTLKAIDGGQILTTAFSSGSAGDIFVDATNSITLSGSDPTFFNRLTEFGPEIVDPDDPASGLFARTRATGSAGSLTINTGQLQVLDGAEVTVSGESGQAGNLDVTANSILLNRGKLTAVTGLGEGGNITLQELDLLRMRDNSLISAEALNAANGGNINIDSTFILAIPSENSDIIANAFEGSGGNINITAQGIFRLQYRDRPTPTTSDINARSEFGVDGAVEIDTPEGEPNQGLSELPVVPVDTQVSQACTPGSSQAQSEFIVTGRGGLPQNPGDVLNTDAVQVDLVTLNPQGDRPSTPSVSTNSTSLTSAPIVEAQSWAIDKKGNVVLIASSSTHTAYSSWQKLPECNITKSSS